MNKNISKSKRALKPLEKEELKVKVLKWKEQTLGQFHDPDKIFSEIESDSLPLCPVCSERMNFYGQIDLEDKKSSLSEGSPALGEEKEKEKVFLFYCSECLEMEAFEINNL
jgi:hypothetical protein